MSDSNESNKVTIDKEQYERLSIIVMRLGLDMNTTEFINYILKLELEKRQEEAEE